LNKQILIFSSIAVLLTFISGCSSTQINSHTQSSASEPAKLYSTYDTIETKPSSSTFISSNTLSRTGSSEFYSHEDQYDDSITQSYSYEPNQSINTKIVTIYENELLKEAHEKSSSSTSEQITISTGSSYAISSSTPASFFSPVLGTPFLKDGNTLIYKTESTTQVFPSNKGLVIYAGNYPSYGNTLFVYGDNNYVSVYYNLAAIYVKKGDYITSLSTPVASASGSFDFEIRKINGTTTTAVDPTQLLQART